MRMEQAFLKAVNTNPSSKLAVRVKKALRHSPGASGDEAWVPRPREVEALLYRWRQLGRKWANNRWADAPGWGHSRRFDGSGRSCTERPGV